MIKRFFICAVSLLLASHVGAAPEVGDVAPAWELSGSDGQVHRLEDLRGKYVVIAFFPKAYTSG